MKKPTKKTVRLVATIAVFLVISALLIRPRTYYSMAQSAIRQGKYEAAFSFTERSDDPRAEELRKNLCFAPTVSKTVYADGTVADKLYVYDDKSTLLRTEYTDPQGSVLVEQYTYDDRGLMLTAQLTQQGQTEVISREQCQYDERGNLVFLRVTDPNDEGRRVTNTYDDQNRLLTSHSQYDSGEWTKEEYQYDELGQVLVEKITGSAEDSLYICTYEYYDVELVKTKTIETATETTTTTYDEEGNALNKVIVTADGTRRQGEYLYNEDGLLDKLLYDDGQEVAYVYDEDGNQVERHDKNPDGTWVDTLQEFDGKKVIKKSVNEADQNVYTYDYEYGRRNLCVYREYNNKTTGEWYRYTFTFDRFGNLTKEVYEAQEGSYTRTIEWQIRYYENGTPRSVQNSTRECKATKE